MTIQRSVAIAASIDEVFHFHDDPANLVRITPPGIRVVVTTAGPPGRGQRIHLRVRQFLLLTTTWEVEITEYRPPFLMVDEQRRGPFRRWRQERTLVHEHGMTTLTDTVHYDLPFGAFGRLVDGLFVRRQVERMFAYRQSATKRLLEGS